MAPGGAAQCARAGCDRFTHGVRQRFARLGGHRRGVAMTPPHATKAHSHRPLPRRPSPNAWVTAPLLSGLFVQSGQGPSTVDYLVGYLESLVRLVERRFLTRVRGAVTDLPELLLDLLSGSRRAPEPADQFCYVGYSIAVQQEFFPHQFVGVSEKRVYLIGERDLRGSAAIDDSTSGLARLQPGTRVAKVLPFRRQHRSGPGEVEGSSQDVRGRHPDRLRQRGGPFAGPVHWSDSAIVVTRIGDVMMSENDAFPTPMPEEVQFGVGVEPHRHPSPPISKIVFDPHAYTRHIIVGSGGCEPVVQRFDQSAQWSTFACRDNMPPASPFHCDVGRRVFIVVLRAHKRRKSDSWVVG